MPQPQEPVSPPRSLNLTQSLAFVLGMDERALRSERASQVDTEVLRRAGLSRGEIAMARRVTG